MVKKYFRKYLPNHDDVKSNRLVRLFGRGLHHHNLWHLHRRSVAGGVAIGLFTGLIPGPLQVISAALFAILFRVNLPVAVVVTFYSNPFTIVPLYFAAYKIGALIVGHDPAAVTTRSMPFLDLKISQWIPTFINWVSSMGKPLAIGLPILAVLLAICGYGLVRIIWRIHVVYKWQHRTHSKRV